VKLTRPRRQVKVFRCVKVKGALCPVHGKPVLLAAGHLFCRACLAARPTVHG
jgi:hypothetical protein